MENYQRIVKDSDEPNKLSMHSISKAEKQKRIWETHTPQPILADDA